MILKQGEISGYRESELRRIKNTCPILKVKMKRSGAIRPVLDHSHDIPSGKIPAEQCGRVRGVISQAANTFLGRVEKYWIKYCDKHTEITLAEALRALADFLEEDHSENPLHHTEIEKHRKRLEAQTIRELRLLLDAAKIPHAGLDKSKLVMLVLNKLIIPQYKLEGVYV